MKKFLKVSCFVIVLSISIFHKNNVYAFGIVHDPELQLNMLTEFGKEIEKATDQIQKLQEQIRQTKALAKSVKDGSITEDMLHYAVESANKCSYKIPNIVLPNFPSLSMKLSNFLCKNGKLPIDAVKQEFLATDNLITTKKRINSNVDKQREDSYTYALALSFSQRTVTAEEEIKDMQKQLQNSSLVNQLFMMNQINLKQLSNTIEVRRLLGALLEQAALANQSTYNIVGTK